jgi:A/G-specific adenine glycosylase
VDGQGDAGPPSTTRDLATVEALLPVEPARAARFSVALMELGALVCTARTPDCAACPITDRCAWRLAGSPVYDGPTRRSQRYEGTDRYVRGLLLGVLRDATAPVPRTRLDAVWGDAAQRDRALASLVTDRLATEYPDGTYTL